LTDALKRFGGRWTGRCSGSLAHALDDLTSHMDGDQFALAGQSADSKEGISAFLQRRSPRFHGR
jgi:enoyl-CoA hydratase/carnithine racemase